MGNSPTKNSTALSTKEQYIQAIHIPICFNNAFVRRTDSKFGNHIHDEPDGFYSSRELVSYTEGIDKPNNNDLLTDSNFKGKMKLNERCQLLRDYNEVLSELIPESKMIINVTYEMELSMDTESCHIYRKTIYDIPPYCENPYE